MDAKSGRSLRALLWRFYEQSNHLGNVLTVVSDQKFFDTTTSSYKATVKSAQDYYPFGLEMTERTLTDNSYRYAFNGKEKDVSGLGDQTHYDYGFRIYNPEIARFLSVDPLMKKYSSWTPYAFAMNRVIDGVDLDGLEYSNMTTGKPAGPVAEDQLINSEEGYVEDFDVNGNGVIDTYLPAVGVTAKYPDKIAPNNSNQGTNGSPNNHPNNTNPGVRGGNSADEYVAAVLTVLGESAKGYNGLPKHLQRKYLYEFHKKILKPLTTNAPKPGQLFHGLKGVAGGLVEFTGKAAPALDAGLIIYDFSTGQANTSTLADIAVLGGSAIAFIVVGTAAAPAILVVGVGYGVANLLGLDDYLDEKLDISEKINFIKPKD